MGIAHPTKVLAATTVMAATFAIGMTVSAGIAAIVFAFLLHGFGNRDYAEARLTSAFHRVYRNHGFLPIVVFIIITYEQLFIYILINF